MQTYVAIMAGGVGSRFWPGSREARPKQFLDMLGVGKSLLRLTFERFLGLCPASHIYIVTNAAYKELILEQLPEIQPEQILCEPSRNNTAPCIAYTALKLRQLDPEARFVVASSDHVILKEQYFLELLRTALDFVGKHDALLTLGITPTRPDTGYGYIQYGQEADMGVFPVSRFTEKPDLKTAEQFLSQGNYLWNAGIFVWKVNTLLNAFQKHASDILDILLPGAAKMNTPAEQDFINEAYPQTPNISIDYAVIEKADNVFTLPADIGWSDLGTWASLYNECPKDDNQNVVQADTLLALDATGNMIRAPKNKLLVIKGLKDYILVDEPDVLLIFPKNEEQDIKKLGNMIKEKFGTKFL